MPESEDQSIRTALDRAPAPLMRLWMLQPLEFWRPPSPNYGPAFKRNQTPIILTSDEFALFNYFLGRYRVLYESITQRVVNRYWNSFHDSKGAKK